MRTICKRLFLFFAALLLLLAGITAYLWHGAANCVPVLNYHQINDTENNALTVKVEQFDKQMQYLADNGYHTITPADMLDCWENGKQLPDKPVIITFDDGYRDNYINAFPILEKYGLKASIFLITDYVSLYPNYVTWDMAKEMQESGLIDLESHTLSHTELTGLESSEDVVRQLQESRNALQYRLGRPAFFIAYPCGSYSDQVEQLTKDAGYRAAFTVNYGLASPDEQRFVLDRIPIFGCNQHTFLRFKLRIVLAPVLSPLSTLKTNLQESGHTWLSNLILMP